VARRVLMPASSRARDQLLTSAALRSDEALPDEEAGDARLWKPSLSCAPHACSVQPLQLLPARYTVVVERMLPETRGYSIEVAPDTTVEQLKALYLAATASEAPPAGSASTSTARRASDEAAARVLRLADALTIRLVFDGHVLGDGCSTLRSAGVGPHARLVALALPRRSCLMAVALRLFGWSPLLLALASAGAAVTLLAPAAAAACSPLRALSVLGALLLLPYGVVLSGLTQDGYGRRLLWPLRLPHRAAEACCGALVLLSLLGCVALGVVLLGDAGRLCHSRAPRAYAASAAVWALLLLANVPWAVLLALPCLLACKSPVAFAVISHLSGVRGGAMQR